MRRPALQPGVRVYLSSQQFTFARWFGTGVVQSFDPEREECVVSRDSGTVLDNIAPRVQTWPEYRVYPAKYQIDEAPEEGPISVGAQVAGRATELGYKQGVQFIVFG